MIKIDPAAGRITHFVDGRISARAPAIARPERAAAPLPRVLARRIAWRAIRQWLRAEMALPRK